MYLHIKYHDNDFGMLIANAIARIWKDIHRNNFHLLENESITKMFQNLNKANALLTMIELAIDAEHVYSDVEFATRGLYHETNYNDHKVKKDIESVTKNYLSINISIKKEKKIGDFPNGEMVITNLETGETKIY